MMQGAHLKTEPLPWRIPQLILSLPSSPQARCWLPCLQRNDFPSLHDTLNMRLTSIFTLAAAAAVAVVPAVAAPPRLYVRDVYGRDVYGRDVYGRDFEYGRLVARNGHNNGKPKGTPPNGHPVETHPKVHLTTPYGKTYILHDPKHPDPPEHLGYP
ncbi:hypothetical protein C8Q72DRAFT_848052 [Fomitopsis betulina]|nr:hypothetical protein C8Q72DRAFT_848052 [Fomitopsis betulina]